MYPLAPGWRWLHAHLSLDVRALAAFRVALGAMVLWDTAARCSDTLSWYTGTRPLLLAPDDTPHGFILHQFLFYRGPWALQALLMGLTAAVAAAFALGIGLRGATAPLLYLLVASCQGRSQHIHDGGDKLLRHLLLWSCFLPLSGSAPARPYRPDGVGEDDDERKGKNYSEDGRAHGSQHLHFSSATVGLTLQVAALYWVTAARRDSPQWWPPELSAVYYMLLGSFASSPFGNWLAMNHPTMCCFLTASGQAAEFIAPALMMALPSASAWRLVPILALVGLQLGIAATMRLVNFQITSILCMVPFLPPPVVSWLLRQPFVAAAANVVRWPKRSPLARRGGVGARGRWSWTEALSMFLLAYLVYHSLGDIGIIPKPDDGNIGEAIRFNQGWNMFGHVSTTGHWWVVLGHLEQSPGAAADGREAVDLLRWLREGQAGWQPSSVGELDFLSREHPGSISKLYRNFRWERYFDQLPRAPRLESRLQHMADWLCITAGTAADSGRPILQEVTLSNYMFAIHPPSFSSVRYGSPSRRISRTFPC